MLPGGKGANQAVALSRLSQQQLHRSQFIGQFGHDGYASTLQQILTDYHVDISQCGQVDRPSGQAFILLQGDGDNSIILVGGANSIWPKELSLSILNTIEQAGVILLQREIPQYINLQVAKYASGVGRRVVLDVGGHDEKLDTSILPYLYVISPNETELERITQLPTSTTEQVIAAASTLIDAGVKNVLVKLGSRGSLLVSKNVDNNNNSNNNHDSNQLSILHQQAFPPAQLVDTTGAGDCFTAAFVVAMSEGKSMQESMRFAAAAATLCIQVKGAMPSMPLRQAVDEFLATLP